MRKSLIIWMAEPLAVANAQWQWRSTIVDGPQPVKAYGSVDDALRAAAEAESRPRITVLLPGERALMSELFLPMKARAKQVQAVPFMLEEQLADDLRNMHFALGPRAANGQTRVVTVEAALVQQTLDLLDDYGLQADHLYIDADCLPASPVGVTTIFADVSTSPDGRLLVAKPGAVPTVLDAALADLLVTPPDGDDDTAEDTALWQLGHDAYSVLAGLPAPVQRLDTLLDCLLGPSAKPIDLLQGQFRISNDSGAQWRPWRLAAALAVLLFGVVLAYQIIDRNRLDNEYETLRTANLEQFQQLFPDQTRIVDLNAQLDTAMARLRGGDAPAGLLFLLDQARPPLVAARDSVTLQELQFRDGALYLSVQGQQLASLEQLAGALRDRPTLSVERVSANSDSDGAKMRLKLSTT